MTQLARQIAQQLIGRHESERADGVTASHAAASACDRLYQALSRWLGPDGCRALFARALAEARVEHPELAEIHLRVRTELRTDGDENIIANGDAVSVEALESLLVRLVELLGRLIGDDMAVKLIERSMVTSETVRASSHARQEDS